MNITYTDKEFTEMNNIFSKRNNLHIFLEMKILTTNGKRNLQKILNQVT